QCLLYRGLRAHKLPAHLPPIDFRLVHLPNQPLQICRELTLDLCDLRCLSDKHFDLGYDLTFSGAITSSGLLHFVEQIILAVASTEPTTTIFVVLALTGAASGQDIVHTLGCAAASLHECWIIQPAFRHLTDIVLTKQVVDNQVGCNIPLDRVALTKPGHVHERYVQHLMADQEHRLVHRQLTHKLRMILDPSTIGARCWRENTVVYDCFQVADECAEERLLKH